MKIALCDDDEKELSNIRSLLDNYQKTHNIPFTYQEYHSSCELALQASKERFDIYLLDILMPHMTGMQLAREIRTFDHAADIIFLTTSSDFAVESYTVKATNYLMKPVSSNAFFAAMDDILRVKTQEQGHFLVLKSRIGVHKVPLSELIYVEAQNRKVIYYTSGREQIVCTELFSSVCNSLLQHREFIQVHRSFLVNMNYIRSIGTMDMCLHNKHSACTAQGCRYQKTLSRFPDGGMIMPELSSVFSLVNYAFVLFFGIVAALYLADIGFCDHKRVYVLTLFFFGIAQLLFFLIMGESVLYKCYPFLIHIPLIALIFLRFHRNLSISAISVLSAYLLCTPRKWFGTFVAFFFDRNPVVSNIASIIITIPLLVLVIRFVSPYIIRLKYESRTTLLLFFLLPLVYYVLEYTFTVYTDLLYTGGAVVIDFMDSFLVVSFFILSVLSLKFSSEKNKAERENILLTTAATQAQKEIAQLSASQQQAAIYRHDLRHHMNFIQSCLDQNNPKEATSYIHEICTNLEHSSVIRYCVNESVNLIVSSYANQAAVNHIPMQISITATEFSRFQITDLCSLFANALENALHACQQMNPQSQRYISLKIYEKNTQLCIQIKNSYEQPVVFADDIPISRSVNHGIGVQSMISVVEKYHGVYGFFADHGEFRFQASM